MLKLHVDDTNVTSGTIPVSWCVSKDLLENLFDKQIKDPAIVLVTKHKDESIYKENRYVLRLKDVMTYVSFKCPGDNYIYGHVSSFEYRIAKEEFLNRSGGRYDNSILKHYDNDYSRGDIKNNAEPIIVSVPIESFAKEPSELMKSWVNHFYRDKPIDECDFRRRKLIAFTLQPIWMLFNLILRFIVFIVSLLIGSRNMSLKYLFHPLTYEFTSMVDIFDSGSLFIGEGKPSIKKYILLPLMPIITLSLAFCIKIHIIIPLLILFALLVVMLLIVLIPVFIQTGGMYDLFSKISSYFHENLNWYLNESENNLIVCSNKNKQVTYSSLPCKNKSIKLRFLNLKSKICQPFAG